MKVRLTRILIVIFTLSLIGLYTTGGCKKKKKEYTPYPVTGTGTGTSTGTGTGTNTGTGTLGTPLTPITGNLIQEIDCGLDNSVLFSQYPASISQVQNILGQNCRTLPNTGEEEKYFAYRVGKGLSLQAGKCYMLHVDFPEDTSRTIYILNWGCETARGIHTGKAVGDVLNARWVHLNPESLNFPLSGSYRTWKQVFWLHDRFTDIKRFRNTGDHPYLPADGFWVIICQPKYTANPMSAGAAVSKIRLYEVTNPDQYYVETNTLPEALPNRHIFWREEMSDNVIASWGNQSEAARGVIDKVDWFEYKAKLAKVLAINTFCKDVLEFGFNQGFDSTQHGGTDWYRTSVTPHLWENMISRIKPYNLFVLPYFEYYGSLGDDNAVAIGSQRRCRTITNEMDYNTDLYWLHNANCDVADPDFVGDAQKLLDVTVLNLKDNANFIGAWFRLRPEGMPVSFNDNDLAWFATEANSGTSVTRTQLQGDSVLLDKYRAWWFTKRKAFCESLVDYMRTNVHSDMFMLYTSDPDEPGCPIRRDLSGIGYTDPWRYKSTVVTDDYAAWDTLLGTTPFTSASDPEFSMFKPVTLDNVVSKQMHLQSLLMWKENHSNDWTHANPPPDPHNYTSSDKVMMSYTFNRQYTVSGQNAFDTFRTQRGLACIRHYPLNEDEMGGDEATSSIGYNVIDIERAGPFCMHAEAKAMANGDPRYLGYLMSNSYQRGFPEYVRAFNAEFLALPALPSTIVASAASDAEVVVREITTASHGTYLMVVNTGWTVKTDVQITIPVVGTVTKARTGDSVTVTSGKFTVSLYPCQLMAYRIQ